MGHSAVPKSTAHSKQAEHKSYEKWEGAARPSSVTAETTNVEARRRAGMHPRDICIGHFSCSGQHTGEAVAEQLVSFLAEHGVDSTEISAVGMGTGPTPWLGGAAG